MAFGRFPYSRGALTREDGAAILALAKKIADAAGVVKDGWNGFNVLHTAADGTVLARETERFAIRGRVYSDALPADAPAPKP